MEHLRREWTAAFVVGELVGFLPPAATGAALAAIGAGEATFVAGLTLAGAAEGAVLGAAQARVLARHAPRVDRASWVLATSAAAGAAWLVGMGGSALLRSDVAPAAVLLVALVPAWVAALAGMGAAQWLVLRRSVPRCGLWIPVTAAAWLVGVMMPVATLSAAPDSWPGWARAVAGVVGAVAMGLVVGGATGGTLARLLGAARSAPGAGRGRRGGAADEVTVRA